MGFSLFVFGLLGTAYAQPLEDLTANILDFDGTHASVYLTWNHGDGISDYEIGCVSCMPNFSEKTIHDEIIIPEITSFANGDVLLYIIAYDDNEIITAKQIMLKLY